MDQQIADHNARLTTAGISLRLERRGGRIGLRGSLPCQQNPSRRAVQRISLALPASESGVVVALDRLRELQRQLEIGVFDWARWGRTAAGEASNASHSAAISSPCATDLRELLDRFEEAFFADPRRRRNPAGCRTT